MKTILLSIVILTAALSSSFAQSNDFREFSWGNPMEKIQTNEKATFLIKVKDDELEYQDQVAGSDCNVIYIFNDNNKLVSGNYFFTKKYANPQLYLQDYTKFKTLLTQKYGKPTSDKETWGSHMPVAEKHNYGQAVADGYLSLNTVWTTDRTQIKINLINIDRSPSLQIQYITVALDELESKEELKKALIKL
ncbi:MAG TPA: hypothetical protein VNS58_28895 [Puia sp.]|nr:hypothetical protein [Puia sp.]